MKKTTFIILIFIACFSYKVTGQEGFHFFNSSKEKEQIRFQLINNLIVIPIEINGKKLSFILDTGVNKTILFNLTKNDSLGLKNVEKVKLQGLGDGDSVDALLSKKNQFRIKNIISNHEEIYVIVKNHFNLSSKMGITIHGIIGYNLLKNLIVKINYNSKKIFFFNPKKFNYKKCRKCQDFPLQFYRKKPYIDVKAQLDTVENTTIDVKMLIDSGGSDALWLFENSKKEIQTPKRFFKDILGEGLSGTIYGNRSRIPKLMIGKFKIQQPTVSFLDSLSSYNARKFKQRNGSIGGTILKRFIVWLDYPNKKITLKKKASLKGGFNYNMSGLDVIYNGKQLIREDSKVIKDGYNNEVDNKNSISYIISYSYIFKPSFKIDGVTPNSPADKAGLLKNDILLKINGKQTHNLTLNTIVNMFQEKDNKKIKLTIERYGVKKNFEFRLEKKI